ncbi:MAG: efflux RND transporter periplasmic adaptor subunit [Crocinitomicaceae bacterium]|nr:efflux RND transporter periplasmic adaptor subunit [Crocinitomicaceae bacterium]MDC0100406.1 efflux RND transporter periplasmic adaptor subunit [Crocinitomicaceae bacterium]
MKTTKAKIFGFAFLAGSLLVLQSCGEEVTEEKEVDQAPLVHVSEIEMKPFTHEIRVQGTVETDQDIILNSEMGGLIMKINVKAGQTISKGTVIASIDASILASNLVELQTQLEYAKYMLDKQEQLNKKGVGSEMNLETAKNQVKSLETKINSLGTQKGKAVIRAPFSGVIDQVFAREGQMAGPASPIVRLVNNSKVDIIAMVSEKHLAKIKVGTEINVTFPNYSDTSIDLTITNVGNYIEPTNRTFRIMAAVDKNEVLLPNMLAEVRVTDLYVPMGFVIPSTSVQRDQEGEDFIYIIVNGKSQKVIINVIEKFNGETLIKDSKEIGKGVQIVIKGAKGIVDGTAIRLK